MPLPESPSPRVLKHTRSVQVQYYLREDELWDIDAHFTDVKPFSLEVASFVIPANKPVHDLWLRITTNAQGTIVDVVTAFDHIPFEGQCEGAAPQYKKLIGLSILKGFRHALKERLSGVDGCTHMNELAELLPAVAAQVFIFGEQETRQKAGIDMADNKPFHLDGCHALRTDGPTVAEFYSRWAIKPSLEK